MKCILSFIFQFITNYHNFCNFIENELIVATTRPETLLGDVAIAVHPEDNRYNKYIGQYVWHSLRETFIPIIGDISVSRTFGTGK